MNTDKKNLSPGLYFLATPIGNARDITLRALDILATADVLAAEDTRNLRRLMDIHAIALGGRPLIAYHDHNGAKVRPRLLAALEAGQSVAYASDAGTPLVADPGFDLGRAAAAEGHTVIAPPGASALLPALCLSGLPTDRFLFEGFLPNAAGARKSALNALKSVKATLVFYESPHRISAMLRACAEVLGENRPATLSREITKKFEETRRGTLKDLIQSVQDRPPKGEIVVLVGRGDSEKISETELTSEIETALKTMSVRETADIVSQKHGLPRRQVYQAALAAAKAADQDGD